MKKVTFEKAQAGASVKIDNVLIDSVPVRNGSVQTKDAWDVAEKIGIATDSGISYSCVAYLAIAATFLRDGSTINVEL